VNPVLNVYLARTLSDERMRAAARARSGPSRPSRPPLRRRAAHIAARVATLLITIVE
jgi:hypothetical protein